MTKSIQAANEFLRNEVCRVGKSLFERGYVHGSTGNISVRVPSEQGGGFLITPTDACLGFLDADTLAWVNEQGQQISGERASKTIALHRRIYACVPSAGCVVHTHSSYLVDLTLRGVWHPDDIVPPLTPYYVMKVGHVPLVSYHRPGDPAVAEIVSTLITSASAQPLRAVMIERLGPNVWHQSLASAMATLEELEETAKLWLLSNRSVPALSDEQINELIARFNLRY